MPGIFRPHVRFYDPSTCRGPPPKARGATLAFAKLVAGMAVVKAIAAGPLNGERPKDKVAVIQVTVAKKVARNNWRRRS